MMLTVDRTRALDVVRCLDVAFSRRIGLLASDGDLVERQVPRGVEIGSREHALFLFYIVPNDRGMRSNILYSRAKALFIERPSLFDPHAILDTYTSDEDVELVAATGKTLSTRYPAETAKAWYRNSRMIVDCYGGDPRGLFGCSHDARLLLREIRRFRGFGPKTGGMLLRAVIGLGYARPTEGLDEVLVPVDIHDSRISFYTGVVARAESEPGVPLEYRRYVTEIQHVLRDSCNEAGVSWLDVDRALWLIGSRGCVRRACDACPVHTYCRAAPEHESPLPFALPGDPAYD